MGGFLYLYVNIMSHVDRFLETICIVCAVRIVYQLNVNCKLWMTCSILEWTIMFLISEFADKRCQHVLILQSNQLVHNLSILDRQHLRILTNERQVL